MYKLIAVIPVNIGRWVNSDSKHGFDRGDNWRELYFYEAVIDWSWFPPNCYGKFAIEMKKDTQEKGKVEVQLSWVKAVRNGGAGKFIRIEGSRIEETVYRRWELYESDYFPLPSWKNPVLLYLVGRTDEKSKLSVAMFTLAVFQKVKDK